MSKPFFRSAARALVALGLTAPAPTLAQEVGSALYVRTDSDRTTVIAPRLRGSVTIEEQTKVGVVYAVDVWTSASIDIMTSASQVPVTEQRDELNVSIDHELTDLTLSAAYRYSVEPDYISHGVSGGFSYDFADNNATIAFGANASSDTVGRAGDPDFAHDSGAAGGRLSFTQVLDRVTVAQAIYELSRIGGYQVSPYRFVAVGGDGLCTSSVTGPGRAALCVPETSPSQRLRHALAVELRRSLDESLSVGGGYRFYLDDWGIVSHTLHADVSYLPEPETILSARYRLYLQGPADHYQPRYDAPQAYVTSDKELSTLSSHRIGLEAERVFSFETAGTLTASLSLGGLYYAYSDFLPLDSIIALELTTAVVYAP
jgi:hypothetical protein